MRGVVKQSLAVAGTQTHSDDFMRLRWVMCRMAGLAGIFVPDKPPVGRFILSSFQHIASVRPVSDYFPCGIHKGEEAVPDGRSRGD